MTPAAPRPRFRRLLSRLLPAVAFAIALGPGDALGALSTEEHAAACKCGVKCRREACCCGPRKSEKAAPRAEPSADPTPAAAPESDAPRLDPSGPCLGESPRDDDAAPVKLATVGVGEAALAGLAARLAPANPDLFPPPSSDRPATVDAPRIDRPPETAPSA